MDDFPGYGFPGNLGCDSGKLQSGISHLSHPTQSVSIPPPRTRSICGFGRVWSGGRRPPRDFWRVGAIFNRFRSDFEPFSGGFIAILSVLGSPGHISTHHTPLETLPGRPKTISHFAISHPDPTLQLTLKPGYPAHIPGKHKHWRRERERRRQ